MYVISGNNVLGDPWTNSMLLKFKDNTKRKIEQVEKKMEILKKKKVLFFNKKEIDLEINDLIMKRRELLSYKNYLKNLEIVKLEN